MSAAEYDRYDWIRGVLAAADKPLTAREIPHSPGNARRSTARTASPPCWGGGPSAARSRSLRIGRIDTGWRPEREDPRSVRSEPERLLLRVERRDRAERERERGIGVAEVVAEASDGVGHVSSKLPSDDVL